MEELDPQEFEDLVQELEGENGAQETLPPEIEELLRDLQSARLSIDRRDAAVKLGRVGSSRPRIVRALIAACESDSYSLSSAAAKSLRAPVHQEYLQRHPDLMEAAERALQQPSGSHASRVPTVSPEAERILFQVEDETSRHKWYTGSLVLEPVAGTITISGYRDGGPTISIPASEIASCEIVAREEVKDRTEKGRDPGGHWVGLLLVGFIAIIEHSVVKASLVPAIKLTQSMSDGASQQRVVHLRLVETGDRGQAATAEMARRIAAFLRQSAYPGVIPAELSEPKELEALLREKRRGGLLLLVGTLSSLAGLVVGVVTGVWRAEQALSPDGGLGCGAGFLVALAVGAVVGAAVGTAVTWRKDRMAGMIMGAISAAVPASLCWLPIALWRVAEMSGPLIRW